MAGDRRPLSEGERLVIYEIWKRAVPREQAVREIAAQLERQGSLRSPHVICRHLDLLDFLERKGIQDLLSREDWEEVQRDLGTEHPGLRLGRRGVNDWIRFIRSRAANLVGAPDVPVSQGLELPNRPQDPFAGLARLLHELQLRVQLQALQPAQTPWPAELVLDWLTSDMERTMSERVAFSWETYQKRLKELEPHLEQAFRQQEHLPRISPALETHLGERVEVIRACHRAWHALWRAASPLLLEARKLALEAAFVPFIPWERTWMGNPEHRDELWAIEGFERLLALLMVYEALRRALGRLEPGGLWGRVLINLNQTEARIVNGQVDRFFGRPLAELPALKPCWHRLIHEFRNLASEACDSPIRPQRVPQEPDRPTTLVGIAIQFLGTWKSVHEAAEAAREMIQEVLGAAPFPGSCEHCRTLSAGSVGAILPPSPGDGTWYLKGGRPG